MSKLRTEDIKSLLRKWINEDFPVRSISLGRGHWEEMAEVVNDAAYEQGKTEVLDHLVYSHEQFAVTPEGDKAFRRFVMSLQEP